MLSSCHLHQSKCRNIGHRKINGASSPPFPKFHLTRFNFNIKRRVMRSLGEAIKLLAPRRKMEPADIFHWKDELLATH